jgi:hypothetical protein
MPTTPFWQITGGDIRLFCFVPGFFPGRIAQADKMKHWTHRFGRRGVGVALATAIIVCGAATEARAQSARPASLRVSVNHAEVVTLQGPAAVALIANPDIADIVNERGNLIFVIGRKPGTTNLLVYDDAGKRLLGREIVVVPEDGNMVTITRETDVTDYYCEPRCRFYEHEQGGAPPMAPANASPAAPAASAAAPAPSNGGGATQPGPAPAPYQPSVSVRPGKS